MPHRSSAVRAGGLSVVLPNYNHAQYLPRALDAYLSQEHPAHEIIVVDDCSTDASQEIVTRYTTKNPTIRLLANDKNVGVIPTLSRGLNEARGEYVYFGAADDFVLPGFFAKALQTLQAYPEAGLFSGDAVLVDGQSGRILGARPPVRPRSRAGFIGPDEVATLLRWNDNFVVTGAAVFRRDAVLSCGGFEEQLSSFADGYLVRKIALTFGFCYVPITVLTWCVFPESVSRKASTETVHVRQILEQIEVRLTADPVFPTWYWDLFKRRWYFASSRLAVLADPVRRDLLLEIAAQSETNRAVLNYLLNIFSRRSASLLILGWLWWRFRPFSLTAMGTTAVARYWTNLLKKPIKALL
jgi:glycosyltransferase involved in cell wall biosynthesis